MRNKGDGCTIDYGSLLEPDRHFEAVRNGMELLRRGLTLPRLPAVERVIRRCGAGASHRVHQVSSKMDSTFDKW